jgi:hypothetical protein
VFRCTACASGYTLVFPQQSLFCTPTSCTQARQYYGYGLDPVTQQPAIGCFTTQVVGCLNSTYDFNQNVEVCLLCQTNFNLTTSGQCTPVNTAATQSITCPAGTVRVVTTSGQSTSQTQIQCLPCGQGCANCTYNLATAAVVCFNCASRNYTLSTDLGRCLSNYSANCSSGYYFNPSAGVCVICPTGCAQCQLNNQSSTGGVQCSNCSSSYYFLQGQCFLQCVTGKIATPSLTSAQQQVCTPCASNCQQCSLQFAASTTTSSSSANAFPGQVCQQCQNGFYLNSGLSCIALPNCTQQLGVANAYYLLQASSSAAGSGYTPVCRACPTGCLNCRLSTATNAQSTIVCGSCDATVNYVANAYGQCIPFSLAIRPTCALNQFPYYQLSGQNWTCLSCGTGCDACQGYQDTVTAQAVNSCTVCSPGYYAQTNATTGR